MRCRVLLASLVLAALVAGGSARSATEKTPIEIRVVVTGSAEWIGPAPGGGLEFDPAARATALQPGRATPLRINSKIRLLGPGSITFLCTRGTRTDTTSFDKPRLWVPILPPPGVTRAELASMQALSEVLDLGGRDRADAHAVVTWPALDVPIARASAAIHWQPIAGGRRVQFEITDIRNPEVHWTGSAPAEAGRYAEADLRRFLAAIPDSLAGTLVLDVSLPSGSSGGPRLLRLLPAAEERGLFAALAAYDSLPEPDRGILRGYALLGARQYADAAEAYEAAWTADTTRVELLLKAIDVYRVYGNSTRAEQLEPRLSATLREN